MLFYYLISQAEQGVAMIILSIIHLLVVSGNVGDISDNKWLLPKKVNEFV